MKNTLPVALVCAALTTSFTADVRAETVGASFTFNGARVDILRDPEAAATQVARFAQSTPDCGQGCLGPAIPAKGVRALGEREVLDFLLERVAEGTGLVVDARMPQDRAAGHIPGSVSLPYATLSPDNEYRADILTALGAPATGAGHDFDDARHLVVYDVGPASDEAGQLVAHLLAAGYPAERISYYRGGMLLWSALGLTIETEAGS